jgi:hypothetical protein
MTCHGCDRTGTPDCDLTFVCWHCHERKRVCSCLVGGFDAREIICAACHFQRATGRRLVSKYTNHRLLRKQREEML